MHLHGRSYIVPPPDGVFEHLIHQMFKCKEAWLNRWVCGEIVTWHFIIFRLHSGKVWFKKKLLKEKYF